MSRRAAFIALSLCCAALAAAVVPWRVSPDTLRSAVSATLHDVSGLKLAAAGGVTVAVLPVPRLAFEDVTLTAADGTPVVRGGTLRGELRILPLLAGRLDFSELSLANAAVDVEIGGAALRKAADQAAAALHSLHRPDRSGGHVARLVLDGIDLRLRDRRTGFETTVHGIRLGADWPTADAPLAVTASLTWRGETIHVKQASVQPDALATGLASPFRIDVSAPLASLTFNGSLSLQGDQRLAGRSAFATRSLRDFSLWSGVPVPLGNAIDAFGLDGDVRVDGRGISWPAIRLALGNNRLEGALSWRADGERSIVTSTLAADRLDLTAAAALFARPRPAAGSAEIFSPPSSTGTDLDLRLSASMARLGPVRLDDLAANLLVKAGRYEASVNRATVNKGIAKGRAVLTPAGDGIEVKGQSSFERIDVASLLADLGLPRWGSGSAQGQIALEGTGDEPAELLRSLGGRAQVTIRQGELVGVGLAETVRRAEAQGDASPIALRGGRTPFEQASLQVTIADGVAAITDAKLSGASVRAALQGRTSLAHHTVAAKASVENGSAAVLLDITGPWASPTIVSGARSARSDAASATVQ